MEPISEIETRLAEAGIDAAEASRLRPASRLIAFYAPRAFDRGYRSRAAKARVRAFATQSRSTPFLEAAIVVLREMPPRTRDREIDRLVSPSASITLPAVCSIIRRSGLIVDGDRLARDLAAMHGTPPTRLVAAIRRRRGIAEGRPVDVAGVVRRAWARRLVHGADRYASAQRERGEDAV